MASIIEGYNYDIFISYRQKDNKGDKWVSMFVEALKTELEATFKEDISVYFDENPHDRLQETHDVNKSLEGKLKCLIFIPVVSQTYCDPNSYAWQSEFLPFLRMTEKDRFGKDVKLRSGNVSSRILPVRIHDLEQEDIKLYEKETGSVLRAVDFVFKTATGVSRPLLPDEGHPNDNLYKTFYRDQINKTTLAIKEIIGGLKAITATEKEDTAKQTEPEKEVVRAGSGELKKESPWLFTNKYRYSVLGTAILLVVLAVVLVPKLFKGNNIIKDPSGKISIAVNNFNDNSADTSLANLKIAIPDILRNDLGNSEELLVQNSQTMFELYQSMGQSQQATILPSVSRDVALKLKTGTFLTGSFQRIGDTLLILAELNDTKEGSVLWSGKVKGMKDQYPSLALSLSGQLKNFLEIKALRQQISAEFTEAFTYSTEAYRKYIEGLQYMMKLNWPAALRSFHDAYAIDTTFSLAAFYSAYLYCYSDFDNEQMANWTQKAYKARGKLPYELRCWIEMWETCQFDGDLDDIIKSCDVLEFSESRSRYFWWDLGVTYESCDVFDKAVKAFEKVEEITKEWGEEWKYADYYWRYGWALHNVGLHDKEAEIYKKGLNLFPDNIYILGYQLICPVSRGDANKESRLLTIFLKRARVLKFTESFTEKILGDIYAAANSLDKAEEHYRNALKLDPNNYLRMNTLALFLIRKKNNVDEADYLSGKVLEIQPENLTALWIKGLVCYEHGKYKEALEMIQHSRDLQKFLWDTDREKDLKKVRQALARQN